MFADGACGQGDLSADGLLEVVDMCEAPCEAALVGRKLSLLCCLPAATRGLLGNGKMCHGGGEGKTPGVGVA